jgi:hypothetical protein
MRQRQPLHHESGGSTAFVFTSVPEHPGKKAAERDAHAPFVASLGGRLTPARLHSLLGQARFG